MGRHVSRGGGGWGRALALALTLLLVVGLAGGGYVWWQTRSSASADTASGTCSEPLRMLVATELSTVTRRVLATSKVGRCPLVRVQSASAQVAVEQIGAGRVPDVWVPDSSTWLDSLTGAGDLPTAPGGWKAGPSVATSPVVLVSPIEGDHALEAAPTSWSDVLNVSGQVRMANPDFDTASRLAYYASRIDRPEALDLTSAGKLIFASRFAVPSTEQLFSIAGGDPNDVLPFPASEQATAAFAAESPGLVKPLLPTAGTMSLDYPWLVNLALDESRAAAAAKALAVLQGTSGRAAVAGAGFRAGGTTQGPTIDGTPATAYTELPALEADDRLGALEQWDILRTDMRMLAILDVSGSMKYPARRTGGMTRAKVTEEAAVTALKILPAGSRIGAWVFSTDQRGKGVDYRELAKVERLDAAYAGRTWREHLVDVTRTLPRRLGGDTGLYDTTAAAYAKMVEEYDDDYVNSVVVMTDGKNDDPGGGLDLEGLLARIRATSKADRPVRVITIGMGEADPSALEAISRATGGTSYIANTPADIQRVFVQALLARTAK
jgi:hypothetical protein